MKVLLIAAALILVLHGLIHLMGTAVYMRLATLAAFPYKTTLLNGRWDLGMWGISMFGLVWLLAGVGTVAAGVGLLAHTPWTQPVLLAATLLSLVICTLDWQLAKAGTLLDVAILLTMILAPRWLTTVGTVASRL